MLRRFGVFGSAGALLASAFIAVATIGISAAHADSFEDWATVSAGDGHTCGVRSNGKLYCWGANEVNQLGDSGGGATAPRRIGTFEDWSTASAGGDHTCGIRHGGKLYCWGFNLNGQIGNGEALDTTTLPLRIGTFEDWATVTAGGDHTCGARKNGKLYCWGDDTFGEIGDGEATDAFAPRRIGTFEDWVGASAGTHHTCGVRNNGKLYCWGQDNVGQVGDGDGTAATSPRRIGTFEDWADASAGLEHTCGVRGTGKLYCWGNDSDGQVGDGTDDNPNLTPQRIGTFEDWANASAGDDHTCGARKNGKLYCWGSDSDGQLGDGDLAIGADAPRRIGTFEDWATASAGQYHTCGVRSNGKLYCWGTDGSGQVGDGAGDSTPVKAPRRI
jgi:alpha-tubulin suppressor-like RCC1 family protein